MDIDPQSITEVVAIDGPAGAGKSTVARRVAHALGFSFLDTGAMYRAATWNAMHRGVDLNDPGALAKATRAMSLRLDDNDGATRVMVDGHDVTEAIRTPEVTRCIAWLDHNPEVRAHLVELQRRYAAAQPTVAEGRDMGTVVFPRAKCKVFLTASLEVRAKRRAGDFAAKGIAYDESALLEDIRTRDHKDSTRDIAPLRPADDAVLIDTSDMSTEQVVEAIVNLARDRW